MGGYDQPVEYQGITILSPNQTLFDNVTNVNVESADIIDCSTSVRFYINTLIAGTLCCFGLIGNTLAYYVLSKDTEAPMAAFLLRTLAVVDNFFLVSWLLHFSLSDYFAYLRIHQTFHIAWLYFRVYTYPLLFVGQTATIWMVVLIASSRYVAVCRPYRALQHNALNVIRKSAMVVISLSVLYNIPRFFETTIVYINHNGSHAYSLERTQFGNSRMYGVLYFDSLYYIFSFALPLVLLVYLNTRLILTYRHVQGRCQSMRSRRQEQHDHNITLVMIVVILVFSLCNAPARVVQIIWGYQPQHCPTAEFVLMEISNVLEVFNSSANFIVYCVCRARFRQILKQVVCIKRPAQSFAATIAQNDPRNYHAVNQIVMYTHLISFDTLEASSMNEHEL